MASEAVWFSVVYAMICVYILTPPTEFITAGLTLTHLFGRFIDKEDVKFVEHHIQRTLLTVIIHTFLPLGKITFKDFLDQLVFKTVRCNHLCMQRLLVFKYCVVWQRVTKVTYLKLPRRGCKRRFVMGGLQKTVPSSLIELKL